MKTTNKYRFSIQFGATSGECTRVGNMLERLGNRKSRFIIRAVIEYLDKHPEIEVPNANVIVEAPKDSLQMETVRAIVLEILSGMELPTRQAAKDALPNLKKYGVSDDDLDDMLRGLDSF